MNIQSILVKNLDFYFLDNNSSKVNLMYSSKEKWREVINKISNDNPRYPKSLFREFRKLSSSRSSYSAITNTEWLEHFNGIFDLSKKSDKMCDPSVLDGYTRHADFEHIEFLKVLDQCKDDSSPGFDQISFKMIKAFRYEFARLCVVLFNLVFEHSYLPTFLNLAKMCSILKPGKDANSPNSYRIISILCCVFRVFDGVLAERLWNFVDSSLLGTGWFS